MIIGIFDDKFFVLDNAIDTARTMRIWVKPSNWFRNDYGMLIPHFNGEGIEGWNLEQAISAIGIRIDSDQLAHTLGLALIGDDFCTMHQMKVPLSKHLPHLKSSDVLYYPVMSRITTMRNRLEFVQTGRAMTNLTWNPTHDFDNFDDYVQDVWKRSLCSNRFAEFGKIYSIELDKLKECLDLQKQGKFKDIDALWECRDTTEIKLKAITMDDLLEFNWGNVEMM